jgi:low affinity Fe/Cu permease
VKEAGRRLARATPGLIGSASAFLVALAATAAWLALGPAFGFSSGWLLVPSAVASIVALLLVVLLQYSQNRDTRALQLKLDEVIRSMTDARTQLVHLERMSDEELEQIEQEFEELREEQRESPAAGRLVQLRPDEPTDVRRRR